MQIKATLQPGLAQKLLVSEFILAKQFEAGVRET